MRGKRRKRERAKEREGERGRGRRGEGRRERETETERASERASEGGLSIDFRNPSIYKRSCGHGRPGHLFFKLVNSPKSLWAAFRPNKL